MEGNSVSVRLDFQHFTRQLQLPNQALIAPDRFAEALHLQQQDLAELARVHRSTISAAPGNARLQGFMRNTLRVLSAASEVQGDRQGAIYWYRNTPIPDFGHRTAEQLVSEGKTDTIISYLTSIASGSSG
jgi:hypothetical protein